MEAVTERVRRLQNRITLGHLDDKNLTVGQWLSGFFARVYFPTMHVLAALECYSATVKQLRTG